jgi:ABC-type uncharacterized transport system substrate-binding protein
LGRNRVLDGISSRLTIASPAARRFRMSRRSLSHLRPLLPLAFLLAALGGEPRAARAHPHVWIDADVTVEFKEKMIAALKMTWVFDEIFTATTIEDFDTKGTGHLDAAELKALVAQSSKSLKNYSFFTYLDLAGKRQRVGAVDGFTAEINGKRLIYRFVVPVSPPVDPRRAMFGFLLYDETYYVDVGMAEGHKVAYAGDGSANCAEERKEDKTTPLYFGTAFPTLIRIVCR